MASGDKAKIIRDYIEDKNVEKAVADMMKALLTEKPDNPKEWLLNWMENTDDDSDELSDQDLQKLFKVARKIDSELVPLQTIHIVISETLELLNCHTVSLFVNDRKTGMLHLFASNLATPIMVNPGQGIAGKVFSTQEKVNIPDCYKDSRFDPSFDKKTGYVTRSMLVEPVMDYEGVCVGVIQAINKMPKNDVDDGSPAGMRAVPFRRNDENLLEHFTHHIGIAMRNAEVYREAVSSSERSQGMLNAINSLSQDLGTQSILLSISTQSTMIVGCQRATVFMVDDAKQELWSVSTDTGQEIRIPKKAGIAGQCCTEGQIINIPDAYADSRFNQDIDKKTGFKTQSILAIPMFESGVSQRVIGVIQMINKVSFDGLLGSFDESDIQVMESFAQLISPKLADSSMLKKRRSLGDPDTNTRSVMPVAKSKLDGSASDDAGPVSPSARTSKAGAAKLQSLGEVAEDEEEDEDD